jgi:hypothetical protein|tara:strand:- start:7947 stop:8303 length:357 start_codon:yes stop_codon:yes gene_type:complete
MIKSATGNPDKWSGCPFPLIVVDGVIIVSRYNRIDEYRLMSQAVMEMPKLARRWIVEVFCDTKASAVYSLEMREGVPVDVAQKIGNLFAATVAREDHGYNGIYVNCGRDHICDFPADW